MDSVLVRGTSYPLTPPKRRIYVYEISRTMQDAQERAFTACLGLAARSLWGPTGAKDEAGKPIVRAEPKYTGDASAYGEAVYDLLSDAGWTHPEIIIAGVEAWKAWAALAVPDAAVKEAADFTGAPEAQTSASVVTSS